MVVLYGRGWRYIRPSLGPGSESRAAEHGCGDRVAGLRRGHLALAVKITLCIFYGGSLREYTGCSSGFTTSTPKVIVADDREEMCALSDAHAFEHLQVRSWPWAFESS